MEKTKRCQLQKILTKLFGKRFYIVGHEEYEQREESYRQKEAEYQKTIESLKIDREEFAFLRHFSDTLIRLEQRLHTSDNASDILKETFRTACEFYDADWAGFLELDIEAGTWSPYDWLAMKSGDMTKTYLEEFEPTAIVPRWMTAMELNQAIALKDREEIRDTYPEEYALYQRVRLYSVMAVPVKPRPCGFLALRNPKRYVDAAHAGLLQLLAFVALVNINDIMTNRMRRLIKSPKDIKSANDIYIKLFGDFQFITDNGTLTAADMERSSTVLFLSCLAIRHKEKLPSYLLDDLFTEDGTAKRTLYNIVSMARKDLQPLQKPDLLPSAKNTNGYQFNSAYNIITDLDRFDELYDSIMDGGNSPRKYINCVHMMELYEGDIAIDCRSEEINHIIRRYRSRFLEIAEKMIGILNESESYSEIRHVAEKGLQIEACNPVMIPMISKV